MNSTGENRRFGRMAGLVGALLGGLLFRGSHDGAAVHAAAADGADQNYARRVQPILRKYCFECHSGKKGKGDLKLDTLAPDFQTAKPATVWKTVEERLASGDMPPKGKPQPSPEEVKALRGWIEGGLAAADMARQRNEGRAVVRRLSRFEYMNTIRDLLAVEVPLEELLPDDLPGADGFENNGFALRVSSVLIERYMEAADLALKAALIHESRPRTIKAKLSYKNERLGQAKRMNTVTELDDAVVLLSQKFVPALNQFRATAAGRYRFRVSAYSYQNQARPMVMAVHVRSGGKARTAGLHLHGHYGVPADKPAVVEFMIRMDADSTIVLTPDGLLKPRGKGKEHPGLAIEWVEVEGPLIDAWPPESYQRLLGKADAKDLKLADAEQALRAFIPRAFRRPVSEELIRPYLKLVRGRIEQGSSVKAALPLALKAVLCSPHFLYLESRPGRLDDFTLASRLSYFLWSSMPDEPLFALAKANKLHDPPVLRQQVERMLKDPKAAAFTQNFLDQWLDLRQLDSTVPDKALYPEFNELLKVSMGQETRLFFTEILSQDLSVLTFVDSDFAMLNEPLARLYGIPGVDGPQLRKVKLPSGTHRGGVLTQASVLKVTANGTTTSPVLRGAWVLRNILGQPVPPPPPNVPAIEPDTRGAVTIRAQLLKHRELASCAACHRKIDPLGSALENFDVMGGWREKYRVIGKGKKGEQVKIRVGNRMVQYHYGPAVEADDVMPDGQRYKNINEFKQLLLADPDRIARCVTEKLLTYGTGSEIRPADRAVVADLVKRLRNRNYGLRTLIHEIVQSDLFLQK